MADDWQVGDLALCVHGADWVPNGGAGRIPDEAPFIVSALFPTVGSKWVVNCVQGVSGSRWADAGCDDDYVIYIGLCGQPDPYLYDSRNFRKVRPLTDEERDEFLAENNTRLPELASEDATVPAPRPSRTFHST